MSCQVVKCVERCRVGLKKQMGVKSLGGIVRWGCTDQYQWTKDNQGQPQRKRKTFRVRCVLIGQLFVVESFDWWKFLGQHLSQCCRDDRKSRGLLGHKNDTKQLTYEYLVFILLGHRRIKIRHTLVSSTDHSHLSIFVSGQMYS